ncbi:CydC ABC-type transport system involved in cytochrome bd biosynthesis, fused ATPase and permease components [Candidatus Nanopelagicaceae bacterium]
MKLSQRTSFALAVALGSFALIGGTGLTVSSAWLITMASQHPPVLVLGVAIVMVRFFGIFRSVARYGERVISHEAIFKKLTGVRVSLFSAIASHLRSNSIDIARQGKTIIDDVERAQEFHLRVTLPGYSALIAGLTTVLIALWIDPMLLTWILPTVGLFALVIPVLVRRELDPLASRIEDSESAFAAQISEASHAIVEAEVFGYSDEYRNQLHAQTDSLYRLERKNFIRTSLLQFLSIAGIGSALVGIALSLHKRDQVLPVHISMAIFLVLVGFEGYTTWFPNLFPAGKNRRASQSVDRLAATHEEKPLSGANPISSELVAMKVIPYWDKEFLIPIDFTVESGETLVITGASGTGKSTLAAALMGFTAYNGSLTIGGIEVREISHLSEYISGTLQQGHIFNTTLRENLKIADSHSSDTRLREILEAVELSEISLDEVLGEFGRTLSGGEAKRLSIARALLSSAPILILDEPLEHLDHECALRIQASIARIAAEKSLIVITHSPWLQYSRKLELARE